MSNEEKFNRLRQLIKGLGPSTVAFSGGVDSSLVAAAACEALRKKSLAVTVVSELCPDGEADEAAATARVIGIRHIAIKMGLLDWDAVASNPPDRCYHCKLEVFAAVKGVAAREGTGVILDGTNADDAVSHRPGLKALEELRVISPLARLGITKAEVREIARAVGLPNFDRPSAPCLATRFPYGVRLTREDIERVRYAEEFIRSLGFRTLRVRDHGGLARVEVEQEMLPRLASKRTREKIVAKLLSLGYNYVTLDMEGFRSGSMDIRVKADEAE